MLSSQSADSSGRAQRVQKQSMTIATQTDPEQVTARKQSWDEKEIIIAKESLANYCIDMQKMLNDSTTKSKLIDEERKQVEDSHQAGSDLLNHASPTTTPNDFKTMLFNLQRKV